MKLSPSQSTSWKLLVLALLIGFFRIANLVKIADVQAAECKENPCQGHENPKDCLNAAIKQCKNNLNDTRQEKWSLQNTIQVLDGQITLEQVQINQTLYQISLLQAEVEELGQRISGLNLSLDRLSSILVERIKQQYKRSKFSPLMFLFQGDSLNNFLADYKYLKLAKSQTLEAMQKAETQRQLYDQQKNLKEEKQVELKATEYKLEQQRIQLAQQQKEKEYLLAITKHDESRYQSLLAQAQAQLDSFHRFVSGQGGASLLNHQTQCDDWGCYYNQRDNQWGNQAIGLSNETMKEVGCLISSMAMIVSHYNKDLTPADIAANSEPFTPPTAYMWLGEWSVNGVTTRRTKHIGNTSSLIDDQLNQNKPVIAGLNIYDDGNLADHFVVIKDKIDGEYIMHDPFLENGHNVKLTDHYSESAISRVDYVSVY